VFELQILAANIVLPAVVLLTVYLVSSILPAALSLRLQSPMLAVAGALGLWVAFGIRNGWTLWPEDHWQRIPAATLLIGVVAAMTEILLRSAASLTARKSAYSQKETAAEQYEPYSKANVVSDHTAIGWLQSVGWILRISATVGAALIIFPTGEAWLELKSSRWWWVSLIAISVSFSWFSLSRCDRRVAPFVGIAFVPWLIAAAVLTAQSFLKVTEPLMAIATVIATVSMLDLTGKTRAVLIVAAGIMHVGASAIVAHGYFYSYLDIPRNLYAFTISAPLLIALSARLTQRYSLQLAQSLPIVLSLLLATLIITLTLSAP
jgi:hypothetical protein